MPLKQNGHNRGSFGGSAVYVTKPGNIHDQYAVAVRKNGTVVGHLPQKVSRVCTLFLKKGGGIHFAEWLDDRDTRLIYVKEALE